MNNRAAAVPAKGLRERNKEDKLNRIRDAAQSLFEQGGYDATTIRDVAKAADVGLGTVFSYAPTKRELIFLVVNDDNERLTHRMFDGIDPALPLLDQFCIPFEQGFRFLIDQGAVARFLLREVTFDAHPSLPPQERRFEASRLRFMEGIEAMIDRAKAADMIRRDEDSQWMARVICSIYRAEARLWLSGAQPEIADGLAALRRSLALLINGLRC